METNHEDRWVADRLASIEPQWCPNLLQARELLDARLRMRSHSWTWMTAAVAAAVCISVLAFPETRAIAEGLWYQLVLDRVDLVRVDLSQLPLHMQVATNGLEEGVQDIDQAEQKTGFKPYLPSPGTLLTNPTLSVTGPIALKQTINVGDLESALAKAGAGDVHVPSEWAGVTLHTNIGPMVEADYPDDVQILQSQPITLSVPYGFGLERFVEVAFRSIAIPRWEARTLGRKFAAHPAWFIDIPAEKVVNIQEAELRTGPALLIEDLNTSGAVERATIVRTTRERMYTVSSRSREVSIKIADALP